MSKILIFAGSARQSSFNKRLAALCAAKTEAKGATATLIDLRGFPMPLYDGDGEVQDGLPANCLKLRQLMTDHQGFLIACPEYNGSITPLLKNTIDWVSRPAEDKLGRVFQGKVAGLCSTSPGALGGLRGLVHVRAILSGMGVTVVPGDVAVGGAPTAFASDSVLANARLDARLDAMIGAVITTASAVGAAPR